MGRKGALGFVGSVGGDVGYLDISSRANIQQQLSEGSVLEFSSLGKE